jgi:hypothetical protein
MGQHAGTERLLTPRRPSRGEAAEGERRLRRAAELASLVEGVREPVVLAVDGLEHWDEISIALLLDLVRHLEVAHSGNRPPLGVVAAYREEGASAPLLRELTHCLLQRGKAWTITLAPLNLEDTLALFRKNAGEAAAEERGLSVFQETGGCPGKVLALAAGPPGRISTGGERAALPPSLEPEKKRLLLTMELLGRPAGVPELARILRRSGKAVRRLLEEFRGQRLARPLEHRHGTEGWLHHKGLQAGDFSRGTNRGLGRIVKVHVQPSATDYRSEDRTLPARLLTGTVT